MPIISVQIELGMFTVSYLMTSLVLSALPIYHGSLAHNTWWLRRMIFSLFLWDRSCGVSLGFEPQAKLLYISSCFALL
jgi:hypothetical protein